MVSIYSPNPLLEYYCRNDLDPSFELLFWIPATCHSKVLPLCFPIKGIRLILPNSCVTWLSVCTIDPPMRNEDAATWDGGKGTWGGRAKVFGTILVVFKVWNYGRNGPPDILDEFIKSSVENLVPIPSESEGIPDNMCDVPFHDNSPPLDISKDQFEDFFDSNDESSSIDEDSFSLDNIEYVEAPHPDSELVSSEVMEIVISEVRGINDDILLTIKDDIIREKLLNVNLLIANIEALKDNSASSSDFMTKSSSTSFNFLLEETNTFDNSLPELETFCFDLKEISSGSTTTPSDISLLEYEAFYDDHVKEISSGNTTNHSDSSLYDSFIFDLSINPFLPADRSDFYEFADELSHIISPPEYDCFLFKNEPNSWDFTMDVVEDTFPTREPRVHNALSTHLNRQLNMDFILSSESLFAYVVWIFLPFLSYSVAPQYLLSFRNGDTIFIPASVVIISLLSCWMYLIGMELS
nr:hypothetical protein [Tanacetum cinerariifolium]